MDVLISGEGRKRDEKETKIKKKSSIFLVSAGVTDKLLMENNYGDILSQAALQKARTYSSSLK